MTFSEGFNILTGETGAGKSLIIDSVNFALGGKVARDIVREDAEYALEEFREKWDKKYPNILKSWDKNWAELTVFFEYPQEIRRIIYTTNAVEGYHRMVRKFTKAKTIFPTDDAIRKVIYMSVMEISKKWTMPVRDWCLAYAQFSVYFEDRFSA